MLGVRPIHTRDGRRVFLVHPVQRHLSATKVEQLPPHVTMQTVRIRPSDDIGAESRFARHVLSVPRRTPLIAVHYKLARHPVTVRPQRRGPFSFPSPRLTSVP